ncbi:MAG: hypothetical protein CGW95_00670 [Phenylobacterium zucineum]|nr:MAG: hypothetical protein CGW95_00670 [Phenylobacterium zucineum]
MKLQILFAASLALASISFSAPAFADEVVVAKLQSPVAAATKFIAGGAMFVCEADTCSTESPSSETFTTGACKTIAKKAGLLVSFSNVRSNFAAEKLAACNAVSATQVAKK